MPLDVRKEGHQLSMRKQFQAVELGWLVGASMVSFADDGAVAGLSLLVVESTRNEVSVDRSTGY